jgi:hypothetical protein
MVGKQDSGSKPDFLSVIVLLFFSDFLHANSDTADRQNAAAKSHSQYVKLLFLLLHF